MGRGQADPIGAVISAIVVAMVALLGIYLFSQFSQTITIEGPLRGVGRDVLTDGAKALVMAVGGTGLVVTALLILQGR